MASSIAQLAQDLRARRTSATELAQAALARARASADLNAFITFDEAGALAAAQRAEGRFPNGALVGIPFAHKDIFCTNGVRTTCASRMLENFVPPYDAGVVEHLRDVYAVSIGKTNMDEFAMGSSNENSHFGAVKNPWDPARVPGGSSGGSAAAVAAGIVPFATGTDTGGSIRQPAAFCGITGLKPTYGRVSRYGMIAYASSLDCAGVLARSAEDCMYVLSALAGHDPRDATSVARGIDDYNAALSATLQGMKIGVAREYFGAGVAAGVGTVSQSALQEFERLGAQLVDISLPNAQLAIPAYYVIAPAEARATSRATTACAMATAAPIRSRSRTCTRAAAARASAPRSSAASWSVPMRCRPGTTMPTTCVRSARGVLSPTTSRLRSGRST
jgi:aspartyl-tRNA(Asn)/glutamyl-tRNA(Gln) amidotransferase subunit A